MKTILSTAVPSLRLCGFIFLLAAAAPEAPAQSTAAPPKPVNPEYIGFYTGEAGSTSKGIEWVQSIAVGTPAYGSEVKGEVEVRFKAPGMTQAKALCWQQPTKEKPGPWGHDESVAAEVRLDADGNGTFVFPADKYPNGPLTLRILAKDEGKKQDLCEVQLFNQGGVVWKQGIPKTDPPAAQGMKRTFADEFDGPLSLSGNGNGARYEEHKTGGGDFSGWPFVANKPGESTPFSQVGTFLRIHASKPAGTKGSAGILSSMHEDGTGLESCATAPCYFECRFLAQSAPGTWPAFWLLTKGNQTTGKGCDELDVIEAYGGWGKGNPNSFNYHTTSHFWNQPKPDWEVQKGPDGKPLHDGHAFVPMMELGGKSSWSTTFHTYGVKITESDTIYYLDDLEVHRHPTMPLSKTLPFYFLINYAIGGISGWHIDLDRYGNSSDMWVDYVRVYQGSK